MNEYKEEWMKPRTCFNVDKLYAWKNSLPFSPVYVELSLTKLCNQKCIYCYIDSCNESMVFDGMDREMVLTLVDELAEFGVDAIGFQGTGEPLLNKALADAIVQASRKGLDVTLTTNGVLFDEKRKYDIMLKSLKRVTFSGLDIDVDRYTYQHNCNKSHLSVVINNIKKSVLYKKENNLSCGVVVNVFVTEQNWRYIYDIVKYYKDLGVDVVGVADIFNSERCPSGENGVNSVVVSENNDEFMEVVSNVKKLDDDNFFTRMSLVSNGTDYFGPDVKDRLGHCEGVKFKTLIDSDGNVIPCARGWGNEHSYLGNVKEMPFSEIWNSQRTKDVFNYINKPIRDETNCSLCQNVAINSALTEYMNPHGFVHLL